MQVYVLFLSVRFIETYLSFHIAFLFYESAFRFLPFFIRTSFLSLSP